MLQVVNREAGVGQVGTTSEREEEEEEVLVSPVEVGTSPDPQTPLEVGEEAGSPGTLGTSIVVKINLGPIHEPSVARTAAAGLSAVVVEEEEVEEVVLGRRST
jgi:hypothetical protein